MPASCPVPRASKHIHTTMFYSWHVVLLFESLSLLCAEHVSSHCGQKNSLFVFLYLGHVIPSGLFLVVQKQQQSSTIVLPVNIWTLFPLFDISVFLQFLFNFFVISQFSMLMCFFLSEEQCCLKKNVIFASNLLQAVKKIPTIKCRYFWATLVGTKAELKKSCILAFALDSNPIVGGESETESSAAIKDMLFKCNLLLEGSQKG